MPFILAAVFYMTFAIYSDDSCIEMTFRADGDCRVGEPSVWCPNPSGPCIARDRAANADALWPKCPTPSDPADPEDNIE